MSELKEQFLRCFEELRKNPKKRVLADVIIKQHNEQGGFSEERYKNLIKMYKCNVEEIPFIPIVESPADSTPSVELPSPTDLEQDVIIKPTLEQGDCFYSAIYRSLRERKELERVSSCLSLEYESESVFIQSFRDKIADSIVAGNLPTEGEGINTYDRLNEWVGDNSYSEVIGSYPAWFREEFGNNGEILGDRASFINRLASHVRKSEEWVGEIEVTIVTKELKKCKILLEIRSNIEDKLHMKFEDNDIIHLYNPSESHYEFFSFDVDNSQVEPYLHVELPALPVELPALPVDTDIKEPCTILYDPCLGTPITDENPLKIINKKLHELQLAKRQAHLKDLPIELISSGKQKTRLDLLIWFCNQEFETIDEDSLLNFKIGNNQFSTSLFESYWDIVVALRLLSPFDLSGNRYLLDKKVETLNTIDPSSEVFKGSFSKDPLIYLNKRPIQTSSSGGASDITVFYATKESNTKEGDSCLEGKKELAISEKPTFFFCSSKLYLKEKSIDKYDIQNIYTAAKEIDQNIYNKEIILLVKDKSSVESTIQSAMRQYLSQEAKYVFGKEDMFASLRKLYEFIKSRRSLSITPETLRVILGIDSPPLPFLTLRLHQTMAVRIISDAVKRGGRKSNRFLIGILPRGGKTFVAGGLIRELKAKRVVVILGAKSETQKQFVDEMFKAFIDFSDYTIVDVKDDASTSIDSRDSSNKYIYIMSIELFKQPNIEHRPLLQSLRAGAGSADLFICDEGHLKQATQKSETAVAGATASYDEENETDSSSQLEKLTTIFSGVPVVYMTGTYRKPLSAFNIPPENTVIWDYEDLQRAKSLESEREYFESAFGKYFIDSLEYTLSQRNTMEDIMNVYRRFPEIHLMTSHFSDSAKDSFLNQDMAGKDSGFPSISQAFTINKSHSFNDPSQWHSAFQIPDMMNKLISYLAPSVGDSPPSILDDIDDVAQRVGDRLRHFTKQFVIHSQLWFLPKVVGSDLTKRMMAFGGVILNNEWFGEYFDVLSVIGDWQNTFRERKTKSSTGVKVFPAIVPGIQGTSIPLGRGGGLFIFSCPSSYTNLKDCIESAEASSRARGRGLIILAQNMLQLGISLKCVDIVALLDGGTDADERIQKMYRALTESTNKKAGFVIDLNYFRSVQAITDYQIESFKARKKGNPGKEDLHSMINNILKIYSINDNKPLFTSASERNLEIVELQKRLTTGQYKTSDTLFNAGEAINRNIEEHFLFTESDMNILSEYKEKDKKHNAAFLRKEEEIVKRAKELKDAKETDDEDVVEDTIPTEPSARESYLRRIASGQQIFKILIRMGTFGSNSKSLGEYKNLLMENPDEQKLLYDLLIQRKVIEPTISQETIFNAFIFPQLEKYLSKSEGSSYKAMKEIVDDPSKYPDKTEEVLEYINKHLAPKDEERKQLGQVYTPLTLVNDMLDKLPNSVWKNKDLKWLDPANGMGNFPIMAFLRLNKGLEQEIPNANERRKHIVTKMLFMLELDAKNVRISKNLFSKIANIEPNVIRTDSLAITPAQLVAKGFPEKFDVIMGNPPFNAGGILKGGGTIWPKFVDKAFQLIKDNGYISFVHPPGWRKFYDPDDRDNQGKIWHNIRSRGWNLDYINVSDEPPKHFPMVDYYVIHAKKSAKLTMYDSKFMGIVGNGETALEYPFIPNMINNETMSILKKLFNAKGEPINIIYNQSFKPTVSDKGNSGIPHYHFTTRTGEKKIYKKEYSAIPDYINKNKVVMTYNAGYEKGRLFAFYSEGTMGTTNNSMYMTTNSKTHGDKIVKFLNSDIISFLMKITQYSASPNHKNEFKILNSLEIPDSLDYGLNAKEEAIIKEVIAKSAGKRAKTAKASKTSVSKSSRRFRKTQRKSRV